MLRFLTSCFPWRKEGNRRRQSDNVVQINENPVGNEEEVKVDDGGGERDDNEICYMDKLPPEILTKILGYLNEQQLVKCRLVNSQWNEICCLLLQDKSKNNPKSKLFVELKKAPEKNYLECKTVITKPLAEFLNCFSPSEVEKSSGSCRPFPFSGFKIADLYFMYMAQICKFVSTFGPHLKKVRVDINSDDIPNFERLWKLLLHFTPNIQHLIIITGYSFINVFLFDPTPQFNFNNNFKALTPNDTFLKNLKVLEFTPRYFGPLNFIKDLLDNAPNIEQVVTLDQTLRGFELKGLEVWQQLKKAHLLKKLKITSGYILDLYFSPVDLMKNLRLENLTTDFDVSLNDLEEEQLFNNIVYHSFKSSQNTLSTLNLANLTMESMKLCFKDIKSLPNVCQLQVQSETSMGMEFILQKLSELCPNITSLNLCPMQSDSFPVVAKILWIRFKGLKSLKLILNVNNAMEILPLDSVFSGFPKKSIERIQSKLELNKEISLLEARRGEQQNPCILSLKDLSRLELQFDMGRKTSEMEKVENQLRNSVFMKILPQHIRENPRSISYIYFKSIYY